MGGLQKGYQCGMLWGSSLAAGAMAYSKSNDAEAAAGITLETTRQLVDKFYDIAGCVNCRDYTRCDTTMPSGMIKLFIIGKLCPSGSCV